MQLTICALFIQSLSHFDHEEDVETQVTEDVFSMQREAWELFEQFERKFCSVHSTAILYRERIVESFQQLHQHLLKKEEVQLAKIAEKKQKAIKDLQIRESLISGLCSSITKFIFLLENEEATFLDTEVLNRFRAELKDLSKCEVALHGHASPINTQVWRGIRHFVKPLQRSLQFDPQSAHTNLIFSKNLKQVRFSPFAQPLKSSNSFDPGLYVLGVPGFHSGQHYWEVDVGHKSNWIVGVVKESVPRKGSQNLDPAKGFWVLNKQGDNVYVGCGLSCPKSLRSPHRIGVFIDLLDGYLAFYDVDTNSVIFEITECNFVGNLLPFFCPGVPAKEEDLGPLTLLN
ncbi:PREDICTED: E3 ubiquitin-protein ligase TRIM21-like [Nanorana parkeri]|uniref:E3 ubiquitin-protein ligase TRIM21-like n=1 Tax=Nanorana parkeri TaxID=125878 RepID=UPI000854CF41|nr:PREDICTED: E3 ubiquitin-protein ligase TRIM21-like [Nanorana parkeri]